MNPNFLNRKRRSRPATMAVVWGGVMLVGLCLTVLTLNLIPTGLLHPLPNPVIPRDQGGHLPERAKGTAIARNLAYEPRTVPDSGGFKTVISSVSWSPEASLAEIAEVFHQPGFRLFNEIEGWLHDRPLTDNQRGKSLIAQARMLNYESEPRRAYDVLFKARTFAESNPNLAVRILYSIIYYQGVTALRFGETENCILCRGESSCIVPISPAAQHTNPEGSRRAIVHFTEYLERFPEDEEVQWLLNLAHMTLGEHPGQVDEKHRISLEHFARNEFDIGRFRDVGAMVGLNHFNQSGGAIMEDFDQDGRLDVVVTAIDPAVPMTYFRNQGEGTFADLSEVAGVTGQLGGLNCLQADYNHDGFVDILVVRGAWFALETSIRPSLLQNQGDGTFQEVTVEARLSTPMNTIAAAWGDYDNDGGLDLLICGERQSSRLYRNLLNGQFEEVGISAGAVRRNETDCKGAAWLDYDNDGFQDLYLNFFRRETGGRLLHNLGNGRFEEVTESLGIRGPSMGFSCWAWDYNNDGWLDLFASSSDWTIKDMIRGMTGKSHRVDASRLFQNHQGQRFHDVAREAGLGQPMSQMGSNFGDLDNDGFLDIYLGTGGPELETLVPNRLFKNVSGARFSDVTASSRTGNLQKGHGVACGDWDRDGQVDIFIQMGGPTNGDRYHNILFQNPGHPEHHWLTLKLIGSRSNRSAMGARIKIVTAGAASQTIHRHISTGSSFGANPLEQTIGLGEGDQIPEMQIHWPASGLIQTFHNLPVDRILVVIEGNPDYQTVESAPISVPPSSLPTSN